MKKIMTGMMGSVFLFGTGLYGTTLRSKSIASVAAVEITEKLKIGEEEISAPLSQVPRMRACVGGQLKMSKRYADLVCAGEYKTRQSSELNLIVEGSNKDSNLFELNDTGDLVFAKPIPMCTIRMPDGRNGWVKIILGNVRNNQCDTYPNYISLGIKKQGEVDYIDRLYIAGIKQHTSTYIELLDKEVVELVPLLSNTDISTEGYTPVVTGSEVYGHKAIKNKVNWINFGSIFRIQTKLEKNPWIQDQQCGLANISNGDWINRGMIGVGTIKDKDNQLVAINKNGRLASSFDGVHWIDRNYITDVASTGWGNGLVYGNGIWCAVGLDESCYSIDGARNWISITNENIKNDNALAFGNCMFMTVRHHDSGINSFYSSHNAAIWELTGEILDDPIYITSYVNGQWICGSRNGNTYWLDESKKFWKRFVPTDNHGLSDISPSGDWCGGCNAHGYFYVINSTARIIARSIDGKDWEKVATIGKSGECCNVTFYNDKLYAFTKDGTLFNAGTFNIGGVLELTE